MSRRRFAIGIWDKPGSPGLAPPPVAPPSARSLREAIRQFESQHVRDVLADAHFDKREAARMLEISLASLYRKLGEA